MKSTQAITKNGGGKVIDQELVQKFKNSLRGQLIDPAHPQYEKARTIYNAMINKRPALIARCANVADVITSVNFARENKMLPAIKSGGHNGPGLGLCDDGLVIDLSLMKGIRVNPAEQTVCAESGCTWGDVDHATHAFGLATVSGVISTTGIGGLTLGGGHGFLSRKYGLTIDNLLEADIVLADGSFVTANKDQHTDLFWAIRGGGGNFGVVTSFTYRLHPVDMVVAGPMLWPQDQTERVMRWYREFFLNAPQDVYAFFMIAEVPGAPFPPGLHGKKACGVIWCFTTSPEEAEPVLQAARDVATPLFEHIGPMPYPVLQSLFDGLLPPGLQWYWKGDFVKDLPDEAIVEHLRFAGTPNKLSTMHLYPINGAVHQVAPEDTAWRHRDVNWSMVIGGIAEDPAENDIAMQWAQEYWNALHPYSAGAAYVNFMMEEGDERVQATYGDNYRRLQKVKAKYDPDNFFRVNQNIKPKM